jgi:hypothetical protein
MSGSAFVEISKRLLELLTPAVAEVGLSAPTIELKDPSQEHQGDNWISLWLYDVRVDGFCRNGRAGEFQRNAGGSGAFRHVPLPVDLYYLITPMFKTHEFAQEALAEIMLTLHENALVSVDQPDEEINTQVSVTLSSDELDERTKLWEALAKPYRLSVVYIVRKASLVSKAVDSTTPVLELLPR